MSNETLGRWLREERTAVGGTLSSAERAELAELRRRVKVLETGLDLGLMVLSGA